MQSSLCKWRSKVKLLTVPYLLNCNNYEVDFLHIELSHVGEKFNIYDEIVMIMFPDCQTEVLDHRGVSADHSNSSQ